ncbi:MAG: hypothetical protein M1824_001416 [Vezdaea acicularis]|nr:MAG: hypothetical protein M1824_001416 [Vezdaea acicularis]
MSGIRTPLLASIGPSGILNIIQLLKFSSTTVSNPSPLRNTAFIFVFCFLAYQGLLIRTPQNVFDYVFKGTALGGAILAAIDFFFIETPQRDFRRVAPGGLLSNAQSKRAEDGEKSSTPTEGMSFLEKLRWSFGIWTTERGTGWNYAVKNIPPNPFSIDQKWSFVAWQLFYAIQWYIQADFWHQVTIYMVPLGDRQTDYPWYIQAAVGPCVWAVVRSYMSFTYTLFGSVTVALGLYSVADFPPMFGDPADAYTLRRWWGRAWHQTLRRLATVYGKFVVRVFGFKQGTFASKYTQLFVGFYVSAFLHQWGAFYYVGHDMGELLFFMSHAAAILVEDYVIEYAQKAGLTDKGKAKSFWRVFGYLWCLAWFSWTTMYWEVVQAHHIGAMWPAGFGHPVGKLVEMLR